MGHGPFATSTLQPAAQSFYPGVEAWPQWPAGRVCPGCAGLAPWWPASSPFRCWLLQGSHLNLKALHILPATSPFILGVSLGWGGDPVPGQKEWKQPTEARCSVQPHHKRGRTRARQRCVCRAVSSLGASALQRASLAGQSPRACENRKAMSSRRQQESWGPAASTADGGGWAGDRTGT